MIDLRTRPETIDKKPAIRSSAYTWGTRLYIAGCGDHRTNGLGKGQRFELQYGSSGFSSWVEWQFNDWVELGGGGMWYQNALFGDYATFYLYAPATEIIENVGNGNCNVHASGILVPASGGDYDVDLNTADKFIPILTTGGYWDWSYPDTGLGICSPAPDGDGNCHLIPSQVNIHTYVADVGIIGDGFLNVTFPGIDPTRIPPQWKMACRVYNAAGTNTISMTWEIEVSRMSGVVSYS